MTAVPVPEQQHPLVRFEDERRGQLESGLAERVAFLTAEETAAALRAHHANQARMDAMRLALIAQAERTGVAGLDACVSMEAWLRTQLLVEPVEARRQVRLARRLEVYDATRVCLTLGEVSMAAARVVVEAVEALPREVDPQTRREAEAFLLAEARRHHPRDLRVLAKHLDEVLDPEGAEQREADALNRAEAKAAREAWCRLWFDEATQSAGGAFKTDLVTGRKLGRMLEGLLSPGRPDPIPLVDEHGKTVSADERRGQALTELVDRVAKQDLPTAGGCDPVVVVTMTLETLTGGAKAAVLDTGERLSPATARRLAARHGVIPAVLGSGSEVLDLGRKARLASKKQRLAMNIQQGGVCCVEGCEVPITWADAHHLIPWRDGGRTDLRDLVMPCRRHHRMADHPDYRVERVGPGRIRIDRIRINRTT